MVRFITPTNLFQSAKHTNDKNLPNGSLIEELGNQVLDHMPMHIGQSVVPTLKTISQLFMIKPEQMHPGSLKVMHMQGSLAILKPSSSDAPWT